MWGRGFLAFSIFSKEYIRMWPYIPLLFYCNIKFIVNFLWKTLNNGGTIFMNLLLNFLIIIVIVFVVNYIGVRVTNEKKDVKYMILITLTLVESIIFLLLLTYVF